MTFNDVLKQYNKYVDNKRNELKIDYSSFLISSSAWERKKATIKEACCTVYLITHTRRKIPICEAKYCTTILAGYEDELIAHVERQCLLEFIGWWDVYKDAYIKGKLYDIGGISDTNE